MIIGIGNDLIDIRRIAAILDRHGERFMTRCFTAEEIALAESRGSAGTRAAAYAKRFAAKEACVKALGTGFAEGIFLKDIGVVNDAAGRPLLRLTGAALEKLNALTPAGQTAHLHLSFTDEPPFAQAFVVIEGR
jgi:holo-[acyl-carrier protein] synthase